MQAVWNDQDSAEAAHCMRKFVHVTDDENEGALLLVAFHSSGANTRLMAMKCLSSQGFRVWLDSKQEGILILLEETGGHPQACIAMKGFVYSGTLVTKVSAMSSANAKQVKMVLKWFHPGSSAAYVILRDDL